MLLKKYLAYVPFWAGPFLNNESFGGRPNNGFIERFFGIKKKLIKDKNNGLLVPQKIGRYIAQEVQDHSLRKLKIEYKIKTNRICQTNPKEVLDFSVENWRNQRKSLYLSQKIPKEKFSQPQPQTCSKTTTKQRPKTREQTQQQAP